MRLTAHKTNALTTPPQWAAGQPLWQRLPKRDAAGRPYVDFMMLAPGLNQRPAAERQQVLVLVHGVLESFGADIVFAEFNLDINLLWVSLRCQPGLMTRVVCLLRAKVPMLRLISHNPEVMA